MLYWPPCLWTFALVCHFFRTCAWCFVTVMLNGVFSIVHSLLFVLCRRMHRRGAQAVGSALASEWRQLRAATNCMVHHRAHMQIAQQI